MSAGRSARESGGQVRSYPQPASSSPPPWSSMFIYQPGEENGLVSGHSSEVLSHPITVNHSSVPCIMIKQDDSHVGAKNLILIVKH
jgi:hypothetical protein